MSKRTESAMITGVRAMLGAAGMRVGADSCAFRNGEVCYYPESGAEMEMARDILTPIFRTVDAFPIHDGSGKVLSYVVHVKVMHSR
ncbi:hypothetical protein [Streptomyces hydrogenans]|uniref:hypothetical protein n=1 Tax=Streptomyces hydrogenans TaxID=1873719 RepID=UPI0035D832D9